MKMENEYVKSGLPLKRTSPPPTHSKRERERERESEREREGGVCGEGTSRDLQMWSTGQFHIQLFICYFPAISCEKNLAIKRETGSF